MRNKTIKNNILFSFFLGVVYALFYDYIVRDYLFSVFDYYVSYDYTPMDSGKTILYVMVCSFPLLLYQGVRHLSGAISFVTYLLVYVPMINTLFVAGYPYPIYSSYSTVLFISMSLLFLTDRIVIGKALILENRKRFSFKHLEILTVVLLAVILISNIRNLHFVNILTQSTDLYELREENNADMRGGVMLYLIGWAKQVFLPILMVAYLKTRQYWKYAATFAGLLLMFMLDMQKLTFLMPFVITALFFFYSMNEKFFLQYFHAILIATFILFPYLCNLLKSNPFILGISAILIMRTQCIEGIELNTYMRFFELQGGHPYTWYTHIGIIRKLTGAYPYKGPLGKVVTQGGANANGAFWLMDGLAAGGTVGILLATLLFILFKSLFTAVEKKMDKGLCLITLIFAISSLMNVSLFTALVSCGFIVFYLVVMFFDLSILSESEEPNK